MTMVASNDPRILTIEVTDDLIWYTKHQAELFIHLGCASQETVLGTTLLPAEACALL